MGILDEIGRPGEALLAGVTSGPCLDPLPAKAERKPLLRCDRCGCFPPQGWSGRHCPTCCGGHHPLPAEAL
jgi:hypothetical protein